MQILEACANQLSKVPFRMQYCPMLDLTGLEDIELELPTDVFFSLFRVAAPPFPTPVRCLFPIEPWGIYSFAYGD